MTKIIVTTSERYVVDLTAVLVIFFQVAASTIAQSRDEDDILLTLHTDLVGDELEAAIINSLKTPGVWRVQMA